MLRQREQIPRLSKWSALEELKQCHLWVLSNPWPVVLVHAGSMKCKTGGSKGLCVSIETCIIFSFYLEAPFILWPRTTFCCTWRAGEGLGKRHCFLHISILVRCLLEKTLGSLVVTPFIRVRVCAQTKAHFQNATHQMFAQAVQTIMHTGYLEHCWEVGAIKEQAFV